jgi:hypothetical protein
MTGDVGPVTMSVGQAGNSASSSPGASRPAGRASPVGLEIATATFPNLVGSRFRQ